MPAISSSQLPVTTAFKRNMTCQTTVSAGVSYISNRSHFGRRSWPFQRRAAYLSASCAANTSWSPWRPSMASARAATVEPFVCWKRSPSCWGRAMESRWQPVAAGVPVKDVWDYHGLAFIRGFPIGMFDYRSFLSQPVESMDPKTWNRHLKSFESILNPAKKYRRYCLRRYLDP